MMNLMRIDYSEQSIRPSWFLVNLYLVLPIRLAMFLYLCDDRSYFFWCFLCFKVLYLHTQGEACQCDQIHSPTKACEADKGHAIPLAVGHIWHHHPDYWCGWLAMKMTYPVLPLYLKNVFLVLYMLYSVPIRREL